MARCGCGGTCNCVVTAGDNTTVTGNGSEGNPFVVSTDVALEVTDTDTVDLTLTGTGITADPYDIQADVKVSTDVDNCLVLGTDGGLFVACDGGGGGGNVLTGIQGGADVISITSTTAGAGTSEADSDKSIAIGLGAFVASGFGEGVAIGPSADVEPFRGVAIGSGAFVDTAADLGVAIGGGAYAGGDSAVAIGNANAGGIHGVSIGAGANGAAVQGNIAIGAASAAGDNSIAIGDTAIADGTSGTPPLGGDTAAVALGFDTNASARGIAIGTGASADVASVTVGSPTAWSGADGQTAVGVDLIVSAPYSTGVGYGIQMGDYGVSSAGQYSTALGAKTAAKKDGSVAIGADHLGAGAVSNVQDQIVLGTANHSTSIPGRFGVATRTPANTADAQGSTGDIAWDASFIYVKTGAGWKRAAIATF